MLREMQKFDASNVPQIEQMKWSWHTFYLFVTTIVALGCMAPLFLWAHIKDEGANIWDVFINTQKCNVMYPILGL